MKKVRITVLKTTFDAELSARYGLPDNAPCHRNTEGQVFVSNGWLKPEGLCDNAWAAMRDYVLTLAHGGRGIYDTWMKEDDKAVVSCNDGLRPVIFLVEATDEDAE